jgi:hypothetical protein
MLNLWLYYVIMGKETNLQPQLMVNFLPHSPNLKRSNFAHSSYFDERIQVLGTVGRHLNSVEIINRCERMDPPLNEAVYSDTSSHTNRSHPAHFGSKRCFCSIQFGYHFVRAVTLYKIGKNQR